MEELIAQVKMLTDTVQTMIQRQEQIFKLQEERLKELPRVIDDLKVTREALEVTDEALKDSLSESDEQIDDLAKITAALLTFQTQQSQQAQ